jgi:CheY-like chemotaxis protein/two-component sensor histidine kinase
MAPIRSAIQILKDAASPEPEKAWAREVIDRQSALMSRLLDDLLDVSRITRDRLELRKETIELISLVQDVVASFRPVGGGLAHPIQLHLPPGPIHLEADPVRLAQVVGNLLQNACKFSNPGTHIDLTVSRVPEGDDALIRVRDYGVGIPANKLDSIFEMFSQVHSSLERSHGGLGIGLHLVKRLVELHGGTVAVSSAGPGAGTEFTLRLPAMREHVVSHAPAPPQPDQRVQSLLRRILVVDDNQDACRSLSLLLKKVGNETETAYDGEEAVSKTESYQPDVILLDIGLPKMNGYDACRAIRARKLARQPVIVALTGWGQEEDRSRSSAAGFDHHLVKPVDFAALNKLLADLPSAAPN